MNRVFSIVLVATSLLLAAELRADDDPQDESQARLAFMLASADEYQLRLEGSKRKVIRHADPILRWDNQVVREDDAALFLWVCNGRPVCGAQLFLQGDHWHHEFQSLSSEPFSVAWRKDSQWSWSCRRPGISLAAADLDGPAQKPAQRLRQMRSFAERFTAAVDPSRSGKWQDRHQLRLLTTPVYRYADAAEVLDGALFAFVQGTNPEVLLLIEAPQGESPGRWQYGFAPMTSFEAQVRRDDKIVWQQAVAPVPTRDIQGPYQFRWAVLPRNNPK